MRVFGLTGGIASGKSLVLRVFREEGVATVDADEVARAVVAPGTPGLAAIVESFGAGVLAPDGALDRKRVAAVVFGDDAARRRLNAILHPRIGLESAARFQAFGKEGFELGCYDAALLVENGIADGFRPLVVVAAPVERQRAWLLARDGLTASEAESRVAAQAPVEQKLAAADVIVWNDADIEALRTRAKTALAEVRARIAASAGSTPRG